MAWTNLTYSFGSVLTSTKMTQNQDNFAALAAGLSGAPKVQTAALEQGASVQAVTTATIRDGAVTNAKLDIGIINTNNIADGAVTNVKIANNAISSSKIILATAGEYSIAEALGAVSHTSTSAAKVREVWTAYGGTFRIAYTLRAENVSFQVHAQIYKNGSAFGPLNSTYSDIGTPFSNDLTFTVGDLIQIYTTGTSGFSVFLENLKIKVASPFTKFVVIL